ncbi:MAG: O-antigen ligase domain-containing protein [Henriciella sp.]|nr:O-antigen ligase domain-containing protein [Henriciella sp.]
MDQTAYHSRAPEDLIVAVALASTWFVYLFGGLYVLGPVLGVGLTGLLFARVYLKSDAVATRAVPTIPGGVWVWIAGMLVMLLALGVGHMNQNLGLGQTIKSTIGWAKGWALLALFPLIGACMNVRIETIIRAAGWVALGNLLLTPVFLAAPMVGLPQVLFVSPLKIVGGPGPEFFAVQLYSIEPTDGSTRLRYFTPWSPAAGMIGNMYLIFALSDKRKFWKYMGILSALAMIWTCKARLAIAAALFIWPVVIAVGETKRPAMWFAATLGLLMLTPMAQGILDWVDATLNSVKSMRADSTRVRELLGDIAIDRWWNEAPIWGHGVVERGPHAVEYMPIGSHHTWFGLLFVKGVVGAIALAIPLVWSMIEFALLAVARSNAGRIAFGMVLLLSFYTIGENLEILSYLIWPGLIVMGIAAKELQQACANQEQA